MDEKPDARDDEHPEQRQGVDPHLERNRERRDVRPKDGMRRPNRRILHGHDLRVGRQVPHRPCEHRREHERAEDGQISDDGGYGAMHPRPDERDEDRAEQRQGQDRERGCGQETLHQPLMTEISSTSASRLRLNTMTTMASAMAASAAATVMTTKTKTCPVISTNCRAKAAKTRLP